MYNRIMVKIMRNLLAFVVILGLCAGTAQAQDTDSRFFDITKHNVQGAFLQYYESIPDAESLLGYPITEEYENSEGVRVQYFQRARLEVKDNVVLLSPLGSLTYQSGVQLLIHNPLACRDYETGFSVCFAFLEFFDAHGGLAFFGYPISPFEFQENRIVQYFQNGRLEWRPSNPEGQRVITGDLGTLYFEKSGEDIAWLAPVGPRSGSIRIVELNVNAFLEKAVADATDQQLIYVVVQDQTGQPVKNATGQALVYLTTGEVQTLQILTGDSGVSKLVLPVVDQIYGESVIIDIQVSYRDLEGQTSTSFRIWY